MRSPAPLNPHPLPSRGINRSKELERQRMERLSVEDRIRLAIGLKKRIASLVPGPPISDRDASFIRPT